MNSFPAILHDSILAWATNYNQTNKVVAVILREDDGEPERYLALIAAANQSGWQAAKVWLEDGDVVAINDLGRRCRLMVRYGPGNGRKPSPRR